MPLPLGEADARSAAGEGRSCDKSFDPHPPLRTVSLSLRAIALAFAPLMLSQWERFYGGPYSTQAGANNSLTWQRRDLSEFRFLHTCTPTNLPVSNKRGASAPNQRRPVSRSR